MPADLAFLNGVVFTSDPALPFARAVRVEGGRITAVGTDAEVGRSISASTRVVDLRGRMLTAGFGDAHVHPAHGGFALLRCDVAGAADALSAGSIISRYAADHPQEQWILGRGWSYAWFAAGCPPASLLDRLAGGRPAYLIGADGHSGWASSAALRLAGLDARTPDPPDGRIERLEDGSPQGTLHEGAMDLVTAVLPRPAPGDVEEALLEGQRYLLSMGVTSWQDAWVTDEIHAAYLGLESAGRLVARVRGALWWDREAGLEQVERLEAARSESTGRYEATSVKLMLDGVCENHTASLSEPYITAGGGTGLDFIDPRELPAIVTALDAAGFQCHFHAIGDAAVRSALDAVEAALVSNGWSGLRHHIAHIQVVDPSDVPRFHRLGVVANAQPLWAYDDPSMSELTVPVLGPERSAWQYPFASLHRSGAVLAMGSDWPVTTAAVLEEISVAVRRLPPGASGEPFIPDERLPLPAALAAFTTGTAHVNGWGDSGMVAAGRDADLVVLSADLFTLDDPAGACVDLTVAGGEVVFER